ncbi:hypothetical protein [Roseicyclus mahoneyensis]|nr:hypothetical protein [Roseicyclus mahoneyensis]
MSLTLGAAISVLSSVNSGSAQMQSGPLHVQPYDHIIRGDSTGRTMRDLIRIVPTQLRNRGCWFYMDPNGQGQRMRQVVTDFVPGSEGAALYHTITTRLGNTWNNRISSVQCDFDASVYCYATLYREADFVGQSTTIRGDSNRVVNLTGATGWDNAVTSFRVVCSARS